MMRSLKASMLLGSLMAVSAYAQNSEAVDANRPVVKIGIRDLMSAIDQMTTDHLHVMSDQLRKTPNAKSSDFHSFTVSDNRIVAWLWPRQCKSIDDIAAQTSSLFLDGRYVPLAIRSPVAYVTFTGGRCISSIEVAFRLKSSHWEVRGAHGAGLDWGDIVPLMMREYEARATQVNKFDDTLSKGTLKGHYPLRWLNFDRSKYGASNLQISFDTRSKCLTIAEVERHGYAVSPATWGLRNNRWISQKGSPMTPEFLSIVVDPVRPHCIRTMATPQ